MMGGIYEVAVEMGSGTITCKFPKDWSRHWKVVRGIHRQKDSKVISYAYFFI
jgi:hypothetical protein